MVFSRENMITPNEILADVLMYFQDESYFLFTKGYYISQMQQALQEISLDTLFQTVTKDIAIGGRLRIPIPEGCYNLREIYVYSGDGCNIENLHNVFWKRRYQTNGDGNGYTSENNEQNSNDPFFPNFNSDIFNGTNNIDNDLYYFNVINGDIHLSQSCVDYDTLRVVFNGLMTKMGDVPSIPVLFREAVKQWTIVNCLQKLRARGDDKYKVWRDLYKEEYQVLTTPFEGTWDKAKMRAERLDIKKLRDMKEYLSSINS